MALRHHSSDTHSDVAPVDETVVVEAVVVTPIDDVVATPVENVTTPADNTDTFASRRTVSPEPVQQTQTQMLVPSASVGLILGGFVALLLSAWAGIIPFVGPTFGFSADGSASWTWNEVHALGAVVPGAVGILMSIAIMASARRPMGLQSAGALRAEGFLLFLCGAWLAVVPVAWPVLMNPYFHAASPTMTLAYWMGYASGPGVLLAAFGAYAMGRASGESVTSRVTSTVTLA